MSRFWTTSGDREIPSELEAAMRSLQAEVDAIESAGDEEACHICGSRENLTEEHTPSKKAGNPSRIVSASVDEERSAEQQAVVWKTTLVQGGAKMRTLCEKCNNSTGRWYNPAYVRLVRRCSPLAVPANVGRVVDVTISRPQRVAKQALTTLLATMQSGVTVRFPHLRQLLAEADARGAISPLRLGLFLRANAGGRPTGIVGKMDRERRAGRLVAEFSFWPLGWTLTFDDKPVEGTADVSEWTTHGYHDQADLTVGVPCQWAMYANPGDFRAPEEFLPGNVRDFFLKHRACGELDSGITDGRVWVKCACGATLELTGHD